MYAPPREQGCICKPEHDKSTCVALLVAVGVGVAGWCLAFRDVLVGVGFRASAGAAAAAGLVLGVVVRVGVCVASV